MSTSKFFQPFRQCPVLFRLVIIFIEIRKIDITLDFLIRPQAVVGFVFAVATAAARSVRSATGTVQSIRRRRVSNRSDSRWRARHRCRIERHRWRCR